MDDFARLSVADQQRFLALIGLDLTIHGRAFLLELQGPVLVRSLAGLNELQHKIASHIAALAGDAPRYPDDILFRILEEVATEYEVTDALQRAIGFAATREPRTPGNPPRA
jgi:hypothetical protein